MHKTKCFGEIRFTQTAPTTLRFYAYLKPRTSTVRSMLIAHILNILALIGSFRTRY
jgi:hypothetical protein